MLVEHNVKNVLNDCYLAFKKFEQTKDMKTFNNNMQEFAIKYKGYEFFTDIAFALAKQANELLRRYEDVGV